MPDNASVDSEFFMGVAFVSISRYAQLRIKPEKDGTVENIEKIKDRIAKLLRMAQDSGSPNEAAIAASRARSLMDKYQISEQDVSGNIHDTFGEDRASRNYTNVPTYMNVLCVAVARLNDCHSVIDWDHAYNPKGSQPKGRRFLKFRGYANDAALALAMFKSLIACIDRLCAEYLQANGYAGRYPRDVGEAFKIACAQEVVYRINEITRERNELAIAAQAASPGTGLAIIEKRKKVDEQYGENKAKSLKLKSAADEETYRASRAGQREGRTLEIQPIVSND